MKKFLYSSLIALAGLFAVSCETERDLAIFDSDQVVAPTVGELAGGNLSKDGADIELAFGEVDFGFNASTSYVLKASLSEDFAQSIKVNATIAEEKVTIKQADLNAALLNLGAAIDQEVSVYFRLEVTMMTDKNTAIESTATYSNVISAVLVPYNAIVPEKDSYDHVWVIGEYCGWNHGKTQFLYNYEKDGTNFSGIIDFGENAAKGWKITGVGSWDDSCNWGTDGDKAAPEEEAGSIQLISSGGSGNIQAYSKRFYHFGFNNSTLVLKKNFGFNQIGIIGLNGDWNNDIVLEYNPVLVRFYADIEVPAATTMKFRADAAWDLNWGVDLVQGGGDIPVEPGKYRVYLDLNKNEFKLDASMFGKEEPGLNEPEPTVPGWVVNGSMNEWGGTENVIKLTNTTGDIWVVKGVALSASDEFKLTSTDGNNTWLGGPEANATSTIKPDDPYPVYKPVLGEAFATGDSNIAVGVEGSYDITLDVANKTITVAEAIVNYWGVIGANGEWNNDHVMNEVMPGIWMSQPIEINSGDWKIRQNGDWKNNRGGALAELGEFVEAVPDGSNIEFTPGSCIVVYNANNETLGTLAWGVTGSIASASVNWDKDIPMNLASDGKWYSIPVALTTEDQFKLRYAGGWDNNRGGVCADAETAFDVTNGGDNMKVTADGTYMIVYDPATETITLTKIFWGIIGGFNSWAADTYMMFDGANWNAYNQNITGEWKIRQGSEWNVDRGGVFAEAGTAFEAVQGGSNINAGELSGFDVIYSPADETILVK